MIIIKKISAMTSSAVDGRSKIELYVKQIYFTYSPKVKPQNLLFLCSLTNEWNELTIRNQLLLYMEKKVHLKLPVSGF